ncbi:MAG: hypothetical protein ACOVOX_10740 [Burkholderiaceae bacterium]
MTRSACLALLLLLGAVTSLAHAQLDAAAERTRIAQERSTADQRFLEQEKACAARFVVTSCVEAARKAHRDAIAPLRQQEILLDDAQRQERAAQRRAQLQEKAAQSKSDIVLPGTQPAPVGDSASASKKTPTASPKVPSTNRQAGSEHERAQKQAKAKAEADRRAKSQNDKRELALRRKAEVEKRNSEKAASGKPPSAALKVPPAASNP